MENKLEKYTPKDTSNLRIAIPRTITHNHSYGKTSPYFRALAEGDIVATYCTACNLIFLPPRPDCPDCWQETEWVRLPHKGIVVTDALVAYAGAGYEEALETVNAELPSIIVYVEIQGVEIPGMKRLMSRLEECDPDDVYIGMPVEARFVPNPNMNALDVFWVPRQLADPRALSSDFSLNDPEGRVFRIDTLLEKSLARIYLMFWHLANSAQKSAKARRILAGLNKTVLLQTSGGEIFLSISGGEIGGMAYANSSIGFPYIYQSVKPDLVLAIRNPEGLLSYFEGGVALIDLLMEGSLWASASDLETTYRLDQLLQTLREEGLWPLK